jgi:magnesium transporter
MPTVLHADHLDQPVLSRAHTHFARISVGHTVGEALLQVQRSRIEGPVVYFYVLDDEDRLQGVVPTRGLLLNPAETPIAQIMVRRVVTLPVQATLLDACDLFIMHRLMALPVVDAQRRVLGVVDVSVYTDEMSDLADRAASADVFQLIGVRLAQVQKASVLNLFRRRFPWLLCNIAGGLGCAVLAGFYTELLARIVVLSLFFPVILALGESVSIQSLTLALQAQHGTRVDWRALRKSLGREIPVGLLLGLASGGLVALTAGLWKGQWMLAGCMLSAITLSVCTATILGLLIPALFWGIQRDAKVASGPIVLAISDVLTLFYFLGLSWWMVR